MLRYEISPGQEAHQWSGVAIVGRKTEWPSWTPPSQMLKRRPDLPRYMPGGIDKFRFMFETAQDAHTRSFLVFIFMARWLGSRLDVITFLFVSVTAFAAVVLASVAQLEFWLSPDCGWPVLSGLALGVLSVVAARWSALWQTAFLVAVVFCVALFLGR